MYRHAVLCFCLAVSVLFPCSESCELSPIHALVPKQLPAGYIISEQLNLQGCGLRQVAFTSSDPDFAVNTDGTIITLRGMVIATKRFAVHVKDESGFDWRVDVILTCKDKASQKSGNVVHRRIKRRWRPLPFDIVENDSPPFPKYLETISSASSVNHTVYYEISGQGVTTDPVGLFTLDKDTGTIHVTRAVDREQYPQFVFKAQVFDKRTHIETDAYLPITVNVVDKNDNVPEFVGMRVFTLQERSNAGTIIGRVNATDRDLAKTSHTFIKYTLLNATDMFSIDGFTGVLTVKSNNLDREAQEKVFVGIEIRDMGGAPDGLSNVGTIVVTLTDINDNPPTFKEKLYKGQVMENQQNVLVLRIPVEDKDMINTPNWKALYEVTRGNRSGNYRMETDPKTNEGLLYLIKPLDYEKTPVVKLEVTARNEAPLVGTSATWQSVPVELTVGDEDEGPEFSPNILYLKVKENLPNGTLIGTYKALDPENKNSNGIKYYKLTDPGNWITVVESTGDLKVANTIDRESPLVSNDRYNISIKAVDESKKTGNGMVILQIEDVNDNKPVITNSDLIMCNRGDTLSSVLVEAVDADQSPYSTPFIFKLGEKDDGKWTLKDASSSSVVLEQAVNMPNGLYTVTLLVKDLQGLGEEKTVNVRVCSCEREVDGVGECGARSASSSLGSWGILALVLSGLLLLLLCLLLIFFCNTKSEKFAINDETGSGGMLLKSNTEAPGEEVKDIFSVTDGLDGLDNGMDRDTKNVGDSRSNQKYFQDGGVYNTTTQDFATVNYTLPGNHNGSLYANNTYQKYGNVNTLDTWRSNKNYLDRKLAYFGEEEDGRYADDQLKTYGNEGMGSPAGSVGCCSNLGERETMDFLNTLGPKFRPLADVCYTTTNTKI
ncbi:desmocollin 2-like protein [Triplophysa dalaica]|uniref:desmocollin 2-like protein n=1 Tax=Triplophysa dalaica TaxID=1582913 RepID=UPI0024E040C7|nr:desmocollin 2-like protein [Triplophysa dalaica]